MTDIYLAYLKNNLKSIMEYKGDFFIGMFAMIFEQFVNLAFLLIIFTSFPLVDGWVLEELLLMYSIAMIGRSIHLTFFDNYWALGWQYIIPGEFDRLLVRPLSPLFQLTSEKFQMQGLSLTLIGCILSIYSLNALDVPINILNVVMLVVMSLSSAAVFVGLNILFMTFSFWIVDSLPLMSLLFSFSDVSRYPISIFPKILAGFITFVLPYAFTAYYPATFFFQGEHHTQVSLLTPFVGLLCVLVGVIFWNFGIKKYVGAGN